MRSRMVLAGALLLGGCGDDTLGPPPIAGGDGGGSEESSSGGADVQPADIIDQSGARFAWDCETDEHCHVRSIDGVSPPLPTCGGESEPFNTWFGFRFFEVVQACYSESLNGSSWSDDWDRFAICEHDVDCPQPHSQTFECRAGFCQNADTETYPLGLPRGRDMERLCLGSIPRYSLAYEDDQAIEAVIRDACPGEYNSPCNYLPDGCPDPR